MRVAVLLENGDVFVEFDPDTTLRLLRKYLDTYKDLDKAWEALIIEIKKQTLYK